MNSKHDQTDRLLRLLDYADVVHACVFVSCFRQPDGSWFIDFCYDDGKEVTPDEHLDLCPPTRKLRSALEEIGLPVVLRNSAWLGCDIGDLSAELLERIADALSGDQEGFFEVTTPPSKKTLDQKDVTTNKADFLVGLLDTCMIKCGQVHVTCDREPNGKWELSVVNWITQDVSGRQITRPLGASEMLKRLLESIGLSVAFDDSHYSALCCKVEMISAELLQQIAAVLHSHDQDEFWVDPDPSEWMTFTPRPPAADDPF